MNEHTEFCVWWNCYACTECTGLCKHFLDCTTEEGHVMEDIISERFEEALNKVRADIRHFDLHDEIN